MVWLLLRGNQVGVQGTCDKAVADVRAAAGRAGAELVEADLTSAAAVNDLLTSHRPSELFYVGHGSGGGLTTVSGDLVFPTDIRIYSGCLKVTFRSLACQLGQRARDWDLTFGDVYGADHKSHSASGGIFGLPRVHADQAEYRGLKNSVDAVFQSAFLLKMRAFNTAPAIVADKRAKITRRVRQLRQALSAAQASQQTGSDPGGGYSVGTAAQLHSALARVQRWLREVGG